MIYHQSLIKDPYSSDVFLVFIILSSRPGHTVLVSLMCLAYEIDIVELVIIFCCSPTLEDFNTFIANTPYPNPHQVPQSTLVAWPSKIRRLLIF